MKTIQYKCKNCGGNLLFSPETQSFHCEYCQSIFKQKDLENEKIDAPITQNPLEQDDNPVDNFDDMLEYYCPSCAAKIITDQNTTATFCCYCNAPVILKGRLQNKNKPKMIIPFEFSKEQAFKEYKKWTKTKLFLPRKFRKTKIDDMKGIYIPYWICDFKINADTVFFCRERDKYSGVRVEKKGVFEFKNLPIDRSENIDNDFLRLIEPFDCKKLVPFSMSYMSGFYSDKYDVSKQKDDFDTYNVVKRSIQRVVERSLHYDEAYLTEFHEEYISKEKNYVLLPIWFFSSEYNGIRYYFVLNGSSGKVNGVLPLSMMGKFLIFIYACTYSILLLILGYWLVFDVLTYIF